MTVPAADRARGFTALQHRDYRLYWFGSFVSLLGSQMTSLANSWQVYRLTHSALMLGMTGLFSLIPMVIFSLYGGVIADAVDRRRLMIGTQMVLMGTSAVLAGSTFAGVITVWVIFGVAMVNGAIMAFNNPARSALIPSLVPREHLASAISLGTTNRQLATVLGPSIAGIIVGFATKMMGERGIGIAYSVDTLSFLAVIAALTMMRVRPVVASTARISVAAAVEGLRFVVGNPLLRSTLLLDFFATLSGSSESLMPIFATRILHVGPVGFGILMAAPSVGAVVTSILLAILPRPRRQGWGVLGGVFVYGLAWVGFGLTRTYWIALLALAVTGAADTVSMVMRQTINQVITPDELRGRMTSVNMVFFMGGPRLGEFESGVVAQFASAPAAAILGGAGVILVGAVVTMGTRALREYRE